MVDDRLDCWIYVHIYEQPNRSLFSTCYLNAVQSRLLKQTSKTLTPLIPEVVALLFTCFIVCFAFSIIPTLFSPSCCGLKITSNILINLKILFSMDFERFNMLDPSVIEFLFLPHFRYSCNIMLLNVYFLLDMRPE